MHIINDVADTGGAVARAGSPATPVILVSVAPAETPTSVPTAAILDPAPAPARAPARTGGELGALGRLAFEGLAGIASSAEEMHLAIARRAYGATGGTAAPASLAHERIAGGAFAAARGIGGAVGVAVDAVIAAVPAARAHRVSETRRGGALVGTLGGFLGDHFERDGSALALGMVLRRDGRDVALEAGALARALGPGPSPRAALLIHGLCETDRAWSRYAESRGLEYGAALAADLGHAPLYLRYPSGLHISENGRRLAGILDELFEAWPGELEELVLIGHSMGGLVARSALNVGVTRGSAWVERVRHVFCLGSPHFGAPLEQGVNLLGHVLKRAPETIGVARVLELRSAGIKDLRYGYVCEEDWLDADPDAPLEDRRHDIPFPESARHYFIGTTVTRDPDHPVGRFAGDLLVRLPSASGRSARAHRRAFEVDGVRSLGGLNHFDLLGHPAVYEQIRAWLDAAPGVPGDPL